MLVRLMGMARVGNVEMDKYPNHKHWQPLHNHEHQRLPPAYFRQSPRLLDPDRLHRRGDGGRDTPVMGRHREGHLNRCLWTAVILALGSIAFLIINCAFGDLGQALLGKDIPQPNIDPAFRDRLKAAKLNPPHEGQG